MDQLFMRTVITVYRKHVRRKDQIKLKIKRGRKVAQGEDPGFKPLSPPKKG